MKLAMSNREWRLVDAEVALQRLASIVTDDGSKESAKVNETRNGIKAGTIKMVENAFGRMLIGTDDEISGMIDEIMEGNSK